MANVKEKPAKPAASKPAKGSKPAAKKPALAEGVGIKDLAADLGGKDVKTVRARIRRIKGGAQVGQGGRYRWDSKADPEYKELLTKLKETPKEKVEQ